MAAILYFSFGWQEGQSKIIESTEGTAQRKKTNEESWIRVTSNFKIYI